MAIALRKPEEFGRPVEEWPRRELADRILRFIDYFNQTMARTFRWTYRGRVLRARPPDRTRPTT